jgi:predicted anti-sigma-YlaC factor YlaD
MSTTRHLDGQQLLAYLTGELDAEQEAFVAERLRECAGCRESRELFAIEMAIAHLARATLHDQAQGRPGRWHCDVEPALDHLKGPYTEEAGRRAAAHMRQCKDCRLVWVEVMLLYPGASANLVEFGADLLPLIERDGAELDAGIAQA